MTRTTTLRRLAASAAVLATLAFGACGGDDDPDDTTDAGASSSESESGTASGTAATGDAVAITDFAYDPADLEVEAGTTVTFTNEDGFAHTVTAKDKSFDSGNLEEGAAFEHTFDEAGTYDYICAIHNSMTGTVTVS